MKVVFMGTAAFSVPVLQALHRAHQVVAVYCQPPRPAGRGQHARPAPVQTEAERLGLPERHPASLKGAQVQAEFMALQADVAVVVAYGLILPPAILAAPRRGCLNIHASLLPRWRGAAPIQRAILAGDRETGICIMSMNEGLDTGPVLLRAATPINPEDTSADLNARLSSLGAALVLQALAPPELIAVPQDDREASYATKIGKAEARLNWSRPAVELDRQIRAFSPFPGAWCIMSGERVRLLRSRLGDGSGQPGQVLSGFTIACGSGALEVLEAQREGKKPMSAKEFLRGTVLPGRLE